MKRLLLGISVVVLMLTTSCGNSSDQKRIAQLEAEIAKLKGEDYRESSSASNDENYSLPSTSQETDNSSLSNNEKVICYENEEIFIAFGDANIGRFATRCSRGFY